MYWGGGISRRIFGRETVWGGGGHNVIWAWLSGEEEATIFRY